ncbi:MAG: hypothetical protein A2664_04065 [Candidatus Taylorbacteria bacterium RIFCSPHIGHO2_01_FULL_46_22b]|uniref:Uncharacterized protein n=1 Tax=Candidatus Taylorbacteria bacterium RIFCSPHIGHO2_01_FULL_46_22b TaxID=1802301 RepID=A0A1G2M1K0_9BACT|nr:MAG: hypothetical protein A2664_04065 [Candidatus Taylorbacteria bacterium RIFCSPHIGHO2_01_FULL_46_22b]
MQPQEQQRMQPVIPQFQRQLIAGADSGPDSTVTEVDLNAAVMSHCRNGKPTDPQILLILQQREGGG